MLKKLLLISIVLTQFVYVSAQELLTPMFSFSSSKTSYVTLKDGSEVKGTVHGSKVEKGNLSLIVIKDDNGKKHEMKAEDIKFMYIAPNSIAKLAKAKDNITNVQKWSDDKLNQDYLSQGLLYFESIDVKIKDKTYPLLMELLNPSFCSKISVYADPNAHESMSFGVGPMTLAGGELESYFIKPTGEPEAYLVKSSKYKDDFKKVFGKCDKLSDVKDIKWSNFTNDIITYTGCE